MSFLSTKENYHIYKGSNGKYCFDFTVGGTYWGFYNVGWSGATQAVITNPNTSMAIQFDTEEEARKKAEEITAINKITWEKI